MSTKFLLAEDQIPTPTSLFRARRLEAALGTPVHIYYKYERVPPAGTRRSLSKRPCTIRKHRGIRAEGAKQGQRHAVARGPREREGATLLRTWLHGSVVREHEVIANHELPCRMRAWMPERRSSS